MITATTAVLLTAVPTPMTADLDLDPAGFEKVLRHLDAAGVDGVFCCGTTGEFTALTRHERRTVVRTAVDVFGAERVVAHVGAASAYEACLLADDALGVGARMLAAITPFYLPASAAGVARYFAALDAAVGADAELYPYLFRALTGHVVEPDHLAELAGLRSVVGAKISGESTARVAEYIAAAPAGFAVYSGNDVEFANVVRAGGAGAASGVSAVFPERFVALAGALRSGDQAQIAEAHARVEAAVAVVGNIALAESGLGLRGLPAGPLRVALDPPTPEQLAALAAEITDAARP